MILLAVIVPTLPFTIVVLYTPPPAVKVQDEGMFRCSSSTESVVSVAEVVVILIRLMIILVRIVTAVNTPPVGGFGFDV